MPHNLATVVADAVLIAIHPSASIAINDLIKRYIFALDEVPESTASRIPDVIEMQVTQNADIDMCSSRNLSDLSRDASGSGRAVMRP